MKSHETIESLMARMTEEGQLEANERCRIIEKVLRKIARHPSLYHSRHLEYLEALDKTFEWFLRNIERFEKQPDKSVEESLLIWINSYLARRIQDLYTPQRAKKYESLSLDQVVFSDSESQVAWIEKISNSNLKPPILSGLDGYIARLEKTQKAKTLAQIEDYIRCDPDQLLQNLAPKKHKKCHCQMLSERRLLKDPADKFSSLSREFNINYQTLKSHWEAKCKPHLQKMYRTFDAE